MPVARKGACLAWLYPQAGRLYFKELTMQPSATGCVSGQVLRADRDEVVADAVVFITHAAGPVPDIAMVTAADGCFTIDQLVAGRWTLRALSPKGETGEASAHVSEGGVSTMRILVR